MKTLDRKRIYLRGLVLGATFGLFLGAVLATLFGGRPLDVKGDFSLLGLTVGAVLGLLGGLAFGLGAAAVIVNLWTSEGRETAREAPSPVVFPGMFGNPMGDPFAPIKERIDAEEPRTGEEPPPAPPATMPEKCPSCGEKLEPAASGEEASAFCYHCGGALA